MAEEVQKLICVASDREGEVVLHDACCISVLRCDERRSTAQRSGDIGMWHATY